MDTWDRIKLNTKFNFIIFVDSIKKAQLPDPIIFDIGLTNYKIRINGDMLQILSKVGVNVSPSTSIFDGEGCVWNVDGEICVARTAYLKQRLIKKNIQDVQKTGAEKYNHAVKDILGGPIYNYMLYKHIFKDCNHVKVVLSRYESDYSMAKYIDMLIDQGVSTDDITIITRDSDMCILNNKVDIQSFNSIIKKNTIPWDMQYLYLNGSDYIAQQNSIEDFMAIKDKDQWKQNILLHACQNLQYPTIFAEIIYQHYDILEQEEYVDDSFRSLEDVQLMFVLFQQVFLRCTVDIIKKESIEDQKQLYRVMNNCQWNVNLSEKERIILLYYNGDIDFEEVVERLIEEYSNEDKKWMIKFDVK